MVHDSFIRRLLTFLSAFLRSRCILGLEILALRQQLGVLKRKRPRPRLRTQDRIFWILLRRLWPAWSNVLVMVRPETVIAWHRAGFPLFWRLKSRPKSLGRPKTDTEIRAAIQKMVEENPTCEGLALVVTMPAALERLAKSPQAAYRFPSVSPPSLPASLASLRSPFIQPWRVGDHPFDVFHRVNSSASISLHPWILPLEGSPAQHIWRYP